MNKTMCFLASIFIAASCAKGEFAGDADNAGKDSSRRPGLDQTKVDKDDKGSTGGNESDGNDGGNDSGNDGGSDNDGGNGNDGKADSSDSGADDIGGNDSGVNDGGDIEFTDGDKVHTPKACEAADIKVINVGDKCPRNMALYTMDDMSSKSIVPGRYVCCSLPAGDILLRTKSASYVERQRTCNAGEVMVGAVDTTGKIYCTKINPDKYKLGTGAKLVCAGEKGGLFGIGATDCDGSKDFIEKDKLPPLVKQLVIGPLGADGCVSIPYGSLVTQQGGRKCENSAAMTLQYKSSGQAVKIFP